MVGAPFFPCEDLSLDYSYKKKKKILNFGFVGSPGKLPTCACVPQFLPYTEQPNKINQ